MGGSHDTNTRQHKGQLSGTQRPANRHKEMSLLIHSSLYNSLEVDEGSVNLPPPTPPLPPNPHTLLNDPLKGALDQNVRLMTKRW